MLTYKSWENNCQIDFDIDNETKGAVGVLEWAYDHYGEKIIYACSFGIEGIVLIDLIAKVRHDAHIVFLDTGVHFKETYDLIKRVKEKYPNLNIRAKKPSLTLEEQSVEYGPELWKNHPNVCCSLRKVQPLQDAISSVHAWISGLRREQSETRKHTEFINRDQRFQSIKVCPLIHWTWQEIWTYVHNNQLPYNPLHDHGYPSIGCETCTLPVKNGADQRSGRWTGTGKTECGLHLSSSQEVYK